MAYNVLPLVTIFIFFLAAKYIYSQSQTHLIKLTTNCHSPINIPQLDPFLGLDIFRLQLKALREHKVLEVGKARFEKYGRTWSVRMMGKTLINTIEPENIKAVLATEFKNFGLGERQRAFDPLLGKGIFTTGMLRIF